MLLGIFKLLPTMIIERERKGERKRQRRGEIVMEREREKLSFLKAVAGPGSILHNRTE